MSTKIKNILLVALIVFGVISSLSASSDAASGDIYFSPSSPTVEDGNSVTVALRINPGTTVDGVQATVTYNPSLLTETSVDTSSSAFPAQLQKTVTSGSIVLALGNLSGGVSSDSLIANISFTAGASSGSAALVLSNANATSSGSYTNPTSSDGAINFEAVPTPPVQNTSSPSNTPTKTKTTPSTSTTKSTTSNQTSSTPTSSSTSSASTTVVSSPAPKISVNLGSVEFSNADVVIDASGPVSSAIEYGTSQNDLNQTTPYSTTGDKNTVSLDSSNLTPGTTYYYKVLTKDASGQIISSSVHSFTTKGYTLNVTVLDDKYHPVAGQTVTLHSTPVTAVTNSQGVAEFTNVAPGVHTVLYNLSKTQAYEHQIYVANNVSTKAGVQFADAQALAVVLPIQLSASNHILITILISVITFVIALMFIETYILIIKYPKMENLHNKYVVSLYLKFRSLGLLPKNLKQYNSSIKQKLQLGPKGPATPKGP